jgi:hypothetical protein
VISAPYEDPTFNVDLGAIYVISGASGAVLQHQLGPSDRTLFGIPLCVPGDLDGDGVNDYLAGASDAVYQTGPGLVYAFSGATGTSLFTLSGPATGSRFGNLVREVGDVDADGVGDFGVGSWPTGPGEVDIYSGATQSILYTFQGTWQFSNVNAVCGVGDIDRDGHADFGIGAAQDGPNGEGAFTVYSGSSGSVIYSYLGEHAQSSFGSDACRLGDTDGDGFEEFAVKANAYSGSLPAQGRVYVYSGQTGALLFEFTGDFVNEQLGRLPTNGVIDINRDGYADIPIGSPATSTLHVYSGRTGTLLYDFTNDGVPEALGCSSSVVGDLNGDGIDDILIGAADNRRFYSAAGRAYVFAGNDLFLQSRKPHYRPGDLVRLVNRGGEPGNPSCVVLTDISGAPIFIPLAIGTLDANGAFALSGTAPPGLAGTTMTFLGFAIGANGHTVIDSSPETIDFK